LSLFNNPIHPHTVALLSAVPTVDRSRPADAKRLLIPGDIPDAIAPPAGCRFSSRCPIATEICQQKSPPLKEHEPGHAVACHRIEAAKDLRRTSTTRLPI